MAALITCMSCSSGDCEHCDLGHTVIGVLGGWACSCRHTDAEREQHKKDREAETARWFGKVRL